MGKKDGRIESLEAEEILSAEFDYIAQSAFQTNEDRARVASFYVVSVGSFIAAMASASFGTGDDVRILNMAFAALFLMLFSYGRLTLLQLVRLRLAWIDSAKAMNTIKQYAISRFPQLDNAFLWKADHMPNAFKPKSVSYYMALQVVFLSGTTFTAMGIFITFALNPAWVLPNGIIISALFGIIAGRYLHNDYKKQLSEFDQKENSS